MAWRTSAKGPRAAEAGSNLLHLLFIALLKHISLVPLVFPIALKIP
jgi:hypothetical protein